MNEYRNLSELLKNFPNVRLADLSDNQKILDFYQQTKMVNKESSVIYKRGDNFFSFLKERSFSSLVFVIENDQKKIYGIGVVSFRSAFMYEQKTIVGYLGDLRVIFNKKLIREWRAFYATLIHSSPLMPETYYCKNFHTVLIEDNQQAKNNLVKSNIENLQYKLQSHYQMYNIIGKVSLFKKNSKYQIILGTSQDKDLIIQFLNSDDKKRIFGRNWNEELDHRLTNWNEFDLTHFLLIKDPLGKLVVKAVFEGTAAVGLVEFEYTVRPPIVPPERP